MFNLVAFKKEHLELLVAQPKNAHYYDYFFKDGLASRLEKELSYTGMIRGEIMVCGGANQIWPGRAIVWTVFNEASKRNFIPVFRGLRLWCQTQPFTRLELSVTDCDHKAMRRAELLGFTLETPCARKFLPSGKDAALYSMVKDPAMDVKNVI